EGQGRAALRVEFHPPRVLSGGSGRLRHLGLIGLGRPHVKVFGDGPFPPDAMLLDERRRRDPGLAHQGNRAGAQFELRADFRSIKALVRTADPVHHLSRRIGKDRLVGRARRKIGL
ncbi:MAG: hypothetical protein ACK56I_00215, partial [bacterium]